MTPAHEAWVNTLLDGLSDKEIRRLHELLGKLKFSAAAGLESTGS